MQNFSYKLAEKETIPCNFCGGDDLRVIASADYIGLDIKTCVCKRCGLIFINPRMTKEWYGYYYASGEYRSKLRLSDRFQNCFNQEWFDKLFKHGVRHGEDLAERLGAYLKSGPLIDVGSSAGGVLQGLRNKLNCEVIGLEPSIPESNYANQQGIKTLPVMIEDADKLGGQPLSADVIVCLRSLNHFLDPRYFFVWAWNHLRPEGRLVLEVKNFLFQAKRAGKLENAIQIDHPFMFAPQVLRNFVESAGFDILFFEDDAEMSLKKLVEQERKMIPVSHIRLVANKSKRQPFQELRIDINNYRAVLKSLNKFYLRAYCVYHRILKRFCKK